MSLRQGGSRALAVAILCVLLAALSLVVPAAPGYDPWSWLIWGREVLSLDLSTDGGPSWKPLPVLFTAPLSVFGDAAPDLWLLVARAAALGAVVSAAVLGHRLAGRIGAVLAGGFLLTASSFAIPPLVGNSEGILILCVLLGADRHLAGRFGQAFALGVAGALVRAEAWPFLGPYALWLAWRDRIRLRWVAPGLLLVPALWFLPELWGSGDLWRGAERAQMVGPDAPALAVRPSLQVIENAFDGTARVVYLGLVVGAVAVATQLVPRAAAVPGLALGVLGLVWLMLVAVMAEVGFSGIDRYLAMPQAIAYVLGGVGFAWAFAALLRSGLRSAIRTGSAVVLALVMAAGLYHSAGEWPENAQVVARDSRIYADLAPAVASAGGERTLEECGNLSSSYLVIAAVAWEFERHLEDVTAIPVPPTVVLRTHFRPDEPIDPPLDALEGAPGRETLARTRYWHVEAACR